jgi:hypothetical protein
LVDGAVNILSISLLGSNSLRFTILGDLMVVMTSEAAFCYWSITILAKNKLEGKNEIFLCKK